jgi:hypothetical protein
MDDVIRTAQIIYRFRAKQVVGIRDQADAQNGAMSPIVADTTASRGAPA